MNKNTDIRRLFNLDEVKQDWEEFFEDWVPNTLNLTQFEEILIDNWTSNCLPRHMRPHDWNLPFAERLLLQLRRDLTKEE